MQAGVSTACLYPKPVEEALYDLAVNGVPCVEIFLNTRSELRTGFAHGMANMMKRFEVSCASVHPFTCEMEQLMFFSEYERRITDALEYHKLYFRFMNIVGADLFVFHGPKHVKDTAFFCERYSQLYRLGKEFGIEVALENVSRCVSASSSFVREAAEMLGNEFSFVLDTKQAVRAGENPFAFLKAAGSRVRHVHISDSGELGDCLLIGRGSFRFEKFFDQLYRLNPDCNVILELYRSGFGGISELVTGYGALEAMLAKCGKKEVVS